MYRSVGIIAAAMCWTADPLQAWNPSPITHQRLASHRLPSLLRSDNRNDDDSDKPPRHTNGEGNQEEIDNSLKEHRILLKQEVQKRIDRLLVGPDAPFDVQAELEKVTSISPPLIEEGSEEHALETKISGLEDSLYKAVKQQDFELANSISNEISQQHVDDCASVLQVNSKFYQAFSRKDFAEMQNVWLADRSCVCIHPSHEPLMGIRSILLSWKKMFETTSGAFQRTWMEPQNIQMTVKATTAVVTCEEHVFVRRFVRGKKRETVLVNKLQSTNIFRKIGPQWYMTYHHASWHAESEASKQALKGNKGGAGTSKTQSPGGKTRTFEIILGRNPRPPQWRRIDEDDEQPDDDVAPSELDSILGLSDFGPLLGEGSGDDSKKRKQSPMSSFDMNGIEWVDNVGDLKSLLNRLRGNHMDRSLDLGKNGSPMSEEIIQFDRSDEEDEDDDDADDDDDEEEEDDDDEEDNDLDTKLEVRGVLEGSSDSSGMNDNNAIEKIKEWASMDGAKTKEGVVNLSRLSDKECVAAIRRLAKKGRISQNHKKTLLTDMIIASSRKEPSMVEVAYDLLYANAEEDDDDAEEEFADQCIAFARSQEEKLQREDDERM